jgi:hypothetical protein
MLVASTLVCPVGQSEELDLSISSLLLLLKANARADVRVGRIRAATCRLTQHTKRKPKGCSSIRRSWAKQQDRGSNPGGFESTFTTEVATDHAAVVRHGASLVLYKLRFRRKVRSIGDVAVVLKLHSAYGLAASSAEKKLQAWEFSQPSPGLLCGLDGRTLRPIVRRLLGRLIMAYSERRYLCGSAYARAAWTPPSTTDDRIAWNRWLKGLGAAIASVLVLGLALAPESRNRPLEATVQMERLAAKLERMKVVHADTAQTITNLVLQPAYDCHQLLCSPAVQARNNAARSRITATLAKWHGEAAAGVAVNLGTGASTDAAR